MLELSDYRLFEEAYKIGLESEDPESFESRCKVLITDNGVGYQLIQDAWIGGHYQGKVRRGESEGGIYGIRRAFCNYACHFNMKGELSDDDCDYIMKEIWNVEPRY